MVLGAINKHAKYLSYLDNKTGKLKSDLIGKDEASLLIKEIAKLREKYKQIVYNKLNDLRDKLLSKLTQQTIEEFTL